MHKTELVAKCSRRRDLESKWHLRTSINFRSNLGMILT
jgi:hypothetical protein